jgi:preprotein translocase subunit SecG
MMTVLYIVHVLVCLGLLPVILLQSGKGGGVSAVFGGGSAGTVFGSRGASNFLTKLTSGAAVVFMITSLWLSWYSSRTRSVVGDIAPTPAAADVAPAGGAADQATAPGTATGTTP